MTGNILTHLDSNEWIATRDWLRSLLAVFISGGATAAYAWVGLAMGHAITESIPVMNWHGLVAVFASRGVLKVLEMLAVKPLPGVTMNGSSNGQVKSYSAANSNAAVQPPVPPKP